MDPLHVLADQFTPHPRHGLAYSEMPDAPVLPVRERRVTPRLVAARLRRTGVRLRPLLPLGAGAPAPARPECRAA